MLTDIQTPQAVQNVGFDHINRERDYAIADLGPGVRGASTTAVEGPALEVQSSANGHNWYIEVLSNFCPG